MTAVAKIRVYINGEYKYVQRLEFQQNHRKNMAQTPTPPSTLSNSGAWSGCAESQGETTCGSICCSVGQYCTNDSQCENFPSGSCDASQGVIVCGSICCESGQVCISSGLCGSGTATTALSALWTYSSAAAASSIATPSSSITEITISTAETTSLTVLMTSLIVITSDQITIGSSSEGTLTTLGSTATQTPSSAPSWTLPSSITNTDIIMNNYPTSKSTPTMSPSVSPSPKSPSTAGFRAGLGVTLSLLGIAIIVFIIVYLKRRNRHTRLGGRNDMESSSGRTSTESRFEFYNAALAPNRDPDMEQLPQEQTPVSSLASLGLPDPPRRGTPGDNLSIFSDPPPSYRS